MRGHAWRGRLFFPAGVVFAVAFGTRLLVPLLGTGGLRGRYDYDPSVYYAAADAMLSGRVPYRDFNLVHPPLLPLVLTPFAAVGRVTTDHTGFVLGNLAFTVLGALNAVLVLTLCRHLGLRRRFAVLAGLFYAVWFGSVNAEFTVRLEPLGNLFFLLGLVVLCRARTNFSVWTALAAGSLFGLTCSVKIWWLLPVGVILAESLARRRWREFAATIAGAILGIVATCGPFVVLAGYRMYQMVVIGQTGRARLHGDLPMRLQGFASGMSGPWSPGNSINSDLAIATFVVIVFAAVLACRVAAARVFVVLLAVQVIALLLGPSWYPFYDDWLTIAGAVTLAAGGQTLVGVGAKRVRSIAWVPTVVAALVTCSVTAIDLERQQLITPFGNVHQLVHTARRYGGCMQSDSPMNLIEADALTRSFGPGCHDAVDVTAPRLGIDGPDLKIRDGFPSPNFNRYLIRYMTSGDTTMASSFSDYGLSKLGQRAMTCGGVVAKAGSFRLYRVRACSHRRARRLPQVGTGP